MSEQIISKRCCRCKQIKPLTDFSRRRNRRGGYAYHCKTCNVIDSVAYSKTKAGRLAKLRYRRSQKGKKQEREYRRRDYVMDAQRDRLREYHRTVKFREDIREYVRNNPEKVKAHKAVSHAIENGMLPKAQSLVCSRCGKKAHQYHHHLGYEPEHWLDVIPACRSCHWILNREAHS